MTVNPAGGVEKSRSGSSGSGFRVGINARALAKSNPAGVSRYTLELLTALAELTDSGRMDGLDAEYLLFGLDALPAELEGYRCIRNAGEPAPTPTGFRAHVWEQVELPVAVRRHDVDVFHTPASNPPILSDVPLVTTVHDLSPKTHPEWFSREYAALYQVLTPLAIKYSDRIVTVSSFTREEVIETYPYAAGKTVAVPNGVTEPAPPSAATPVDGLEPGFVLFVGSSNPRKNLDTLLEAYELYRDRVDAPRPLVLAGPDRDIFARQDCPQPDGVRPLGYVSDEELAWLYRHAATFAFPSLYEGFGLPVLEAMSVGTPVVTANRGALAEVAGDAGRLVDPEDETAIADGLVDVIESDPDSFDRGPARASRFTWERAARQTAAVYHEATYQRA